MARRDTGRLTIGAGTLALLAGFGLAAGIVASPRIRSWFRNAARLEEPAAAGARPARPGPQAKPAGPARTKAPAGAPQERPAKQVLVSSLAGPWYPADREKLEAQIRGFLDKAKVEPLAKVQALLLPHAGYRYSGPVAACGVKMVAGKHYRRVVVMGPSHRLGLENVASVPAVTHYATPLGEIPLDLAFLAALKRHPCFRTVPAAHRGEHSVQIELPLLQVALGTFRLVPIVVGQLDLETTRRMAAILRGLVDAETLVVASSDFTHYGRDFGYVPFVDDVPENLKKLDLGAFQEIQEKDVKGFIDYLRKTGATVCGRHPIAVLLAMLPPASRPHRLRYATSGASTGDFSHCVSYLAAAFEGTWPKTPAVPPAGGEGPLTRAEQTRLLELARKTIAFAAEKRRVPTAGELGLEVPPRLRVVRAAFVTLMKQGRLRGCIGEIFPRRPLYRSVIANAVQAAFNDRRFPPVRADEIPDLHLEISVLTPPRPIDSYREIVLGRHGVVLSKEGRRAVFLPQVAPAQGWDIETMLRHLARKAGLPDDAWKEGASFTVFEAQVFGEEEKG